MFGGPLEHQSSIQVACSPISRACYVFYTLPRVYGWHHETSSPRRRGSSRTGRSVSLSRDVIPAPAGIQSLEPAWIPAGAGMTRGAVACAEGVWKRYRVHNTLEPAGKIRHNRAAPQIKDIIGDVSVRLQERRQGQLGRLDGWVGDPADGLSI